MKYVSLVITWAFSLSTWLPIEAQLKSKALNDLHIDTLYIFEPCGDIYFNAKKQGDLPSEQLTMAFSEGMKENISDHLNEIHVQYIPVENSSDSMYAMHFFERLRYFESLSKKEFERKELDNDIVKLLKDKPGRYIGVIFINGYVQRHYAEKLIGGLALFAATLILTYGESYYLYTPKEPFAEATLIIIDRQEKKYLYYCNHRVVNDPLKPQTVKHLSKELISGFE